jgi:putative endonuclease
MPRQYYIYILASRSRRLYVGVTNDLERRLAQHRAGLFRGHTWKYRIHCLVYFETTRDVRAAIARERALKGWTRERKLRLIEETNAGWLDLAAGWTLPPIPPV